MKPTISRIVHYTLSEADVKHITGLSTGADRHLHTGSPITVGDTCSAIVTLVHDESDRPLVNLHVFLDGNDTIWAPGVKGDPDGAPGTWHWPPREEKKPEQAPDAEAGKGGKSK